MSDPLFTTHNLSLAYGQRVIIRDVNITIAAQQTTVLIGANGSGKSTLFKGLSRQLKPHSGSVYFCGRPVTELNPKEYAQQVALLPQAPVVPEGLTVIELVARGRHPHRRWWGARSADDDAAVAKALEMTGLVDLAERPVEQLSGGQRQRAWIALILAQSTHTVLLDEPTTALDLAHQIELLDLLTTLRQENKERTTVVAVLHELNLAARVADQVIALKDGQVALTGRPHEVFTPSALSEIFGLEADVIEDPSQGHPVILPRSARTAGTYIRTCDG